MTVLTTIPNGASNKDIRDTINQLLTDVAALTATGSSYTPPAYVYNFSNAAASNRIKAARDRVKNGTGSALGVVEGDSLVAGAGAGSASADATNMTGAFQYAITQALATALSSSGVPAISDALLGTSLTPTDYTAYDARAVPGPYTQWNGNPIVGGYPWRTTTVGDEFTFTPILPWQSLTVFSAADYAGVPYVDGVALPDQGNGTFINGVCRRFYAAPTLGVHTIKYRHLGTDGQTASQPMGFVPSDGTAKLRMVQGAAWGRALSEEVQFDGGNFYGSAIFKAIGHDFAVICMGANDISHGEDPSTYAAALDTIVTTAKNGGAANVILCSMPSENPATFGRTEAYQKTIWDAMKAYALAHDCIHISFFEQNVDYATGSAAGQYFDYVHRTRAWYAWAAGVIRDVIVNL